MPDKKTESIFDFDVIAILGLIFAIIGVCGSFIPFCGLFFPFISGIMSGIGLKSEKYRIIAIIGIVISVISFIISIAFTLLGIGSVFFRES